MTRKVDISKREYEFSVEEVLKLIRPVKPFRFIDKITHMSEEKITAIHKWKPISGHMGNTDYQVGYKLNGLDLDSSYFFQKDPTKFRVGYELTQEDVDLYCKQHPMVTPGVLTQEMGNQVGLVAWGAYLYGLALGKYEVLIKKGMALEANQVMYRLPVLPGDTIEMTATFGATGFIKKRKMRVEVSAKHLTGPHQGKECFKGVLTAIFQNITE